MDDLLSGRSSMSFVFGAFTAAVISSARVVISVALGSAGRSWRCAVRGGRLETRAEELVDDGDGLVVRDEACRQYEYVGVVVQTCQLGYLGYPAEPAADAAVLVERVIPSPEPHIPMPAGNSPDATASASGCAKSG